MRVVLVLSMLLTLACTRPPVPKSARLWLAGDVFLGAGGHAQLADLPGLTGPGAGIVNLEGPVAPTATEGGEVRLVHGEAALAELAVAGVRVTGIANNHAHDAGTEGITRTIERLRSHGIQPAGVARLQVDGVSVVVTAHDLQAGVPPDLLPQLRAAKRPGDVLVATFHVTGPASYLPRPELREAVAIALQAGALVIAAHGTHALGPVERRGAAIIAWGLGNLAFACECTQESEAMLLRVTLDATHVLRAEVVPIDAGLHGQPAHKALDPGGILDLLDGLGGTKLERHDGLGTF